MAKQLFNRKSNDVIQFALSHTLQQFVQQYSETTTANEATLTTAYNSIVGSKTKSNIAVRSGDGQPDKPLKPVNEQVPQSQGYAIGDDGELHKIDFSEVPTRTDIDEDGQKTQNSPSKIDENVSDEQIDSKVKKTAKKTDKKSKVKTESKDGQKSKRQYIEQFLTEDGSLTTKQLGEKLKQVGYDKLYASEVYAVKDKMKNNG